MKAVAYGVLAVLFVLHTDVWYWDDPRMVLGLPIGLTYHVAWTLIVSVALWLTVRYAWPRELEATAEHTAHDSPDRRNHGATSGSGGGSP